LSIALLIVVDRCRSLSIVVDRVVDRVVDHVVDR
jgi:hypothetical protein